MTKWGGTDLTNTWNYNQTSPSDPSGFQYWTLLCLQDCWLPMMKLIVTSDQVSKLITELHLQLLSLWEEERERPSGGDRIYTLHCTAEITTTGDTLMSGLYHYKIIIKINIIYDHDSNHHLLNPVKVSVHWQDYIQMTTEKSIPKMHKMSGWRDTSLVDCNLSGYILLIFCQLLHKSSVKI